MYRRKEKDSKSLVMKLLLEKYKFVRYNNQKLRQQVVPALSNSNQSNTWA